MRRQGLRYYTGLLFSLLLTVASSVNVCAGLNASVVYGIPAQLEGSEAQLAIEVCSYIAQLFSQTGRYAYVGNLCGAYTQNCYVYYIAEYFETYPYDFIAIYYRGHSVYRKPNQDPYYHHNHTFLYDNDGGLRHCDRIYDAQIGARTLNAKHKFVFLWSCGTANENQTGEVIGSIAQLVKNGGFESGSSYWVLGGDGDYAVTNEDRLFGSNSLLLGFKRATLGKDKSAYAYQLISLPAGVQIWLTFWYHLYTYDRADYDRFEVYIAPVGGNPTRVFYKGGTARGSLTEFKWLEDQVIIDLSAYAGQSIYLYFRVINGGDANHRTWCYIDYVSVTTGHTWGMAASWIKRTRQQGLSLDGYASPDGSGRCFIGWQYYSMPLSNATGYGTYTYADFVKTFYRYMLVYNYNVREALNASSRQHIGKPFEASTIYQGWWQYFPEQNVMLYCKVRVWGDGGMRLP